MTKQRPFIPALFVGILLLIAVGLAACGANSTAAEPTAVESVEAPVEPTVAVEPTAAPAVEAEPAVTETVTVTVAADTTTTAATSADNSTASQPSGSAVARTFQNDQSQSEARFTLDEKLMGAPKTVVGVTPLISGAIEIDLADPTKTTISPIQIDARGFTTDSDMRNRAIQRFVLGSNSDENRYIVFTPTAITGLPTTAAVGDAFALQIAGDLTISGVTQPVTFDTTVTADSETQLSGLAQTQVLRSDFALTIPNVPSVADVTDEVLLEFQFVATAE